ncbi:Mss4-like protein [Phlyctochytrium arcticum]|nr:Mss4-like protein [Phlyctochytrium arcticum]
MDQAAILAALPSGPSGKASADLDTLEAITQRLPDLSVTNPQGRNSLTIHCPKCDCVVLRAGAATKVSADPSVDLPPISATSQNHPVYLWQVTDMMHFENIGFSKPVPNVPFRYLSCAECDIGPIGYHPSIPPTSAAPSLPAFALGENEGAPDDSSANTIRKVFNIAADRVRYKCNWLGEIPSVAIYYTSHEAANGTDRLQPHHATD